MVGSSKVRQLMSKVQSQMRAGKFRLARRNLEKLLQIDDSNARARKSLAVCILRQGKVTIEDVRYAMEAISPLMEGDDPEAWAIAGDAFWAQSRVAQASECYHKALERGYRGLEMLTRLGEIYRNSGEISKAKEFLNCALRRADYVPAMRHLASIYKEEGEPRKAIRLLRKAAAARPSCAQIHSEIGHIYLGELKNLYHAELNFKRALLADPGDAMAYHGLAIIRSLEGDIRGALELNDKALQFDPYCAPALAFAGSLYEEMGEMYRAERAYKKACRMKPQDLSLVLELGRIYIARNKMEKAMEQFKKVMDVPGYDIIARFYLGKGHFSSGDAERAIELLIEAFDRLMKNPESLHALPPGYTPSDLQRELTGLLSLAITLMDDKRAALELLEKLSQNNPKEMLFSLSLASIYADMGQFERALGEIEKARRRYPDDSRIYVSKGWICGLMGDNASAREAYEKAALLEPDNEEIVTCLGDVFAQEGEWDRAKDVWEKALEINRRNPEIWTRLAMAYEQLGELPRARRYWEDYLKVTTALEVLPYLAEITFRMGDYGSSREYCKSALEHCRSDGLANFVMGLLLCADGDCQGALKAWKATWAEEPDVLSMYSDLTSCLPEETTRTLVEFVKKSRYRGDFKRAIMGLIDGGQFALDATIKNGKKENRCL